ncbi:MAG: hypothetical protein ABIJ08_04065 [Nanoarchaeota archaeon]
MEKYTPISADIQPNSTRTKKMTQTDPVHSLLMNLFSRDVPNELELSDKVKTDSWMSNRRIKHSVKSGLKKNKYFIETEFGKLVAAGKGMAFVQDDRVIAYSDKGWQKADYPHGGILPILSNMPTAQFDFLNKPIIYSTFDQYATLSLEDNIHIVYSTRYIKPVSWEGSLNGVEKKVAIARIKVNPKEGTIEDKHLKDFYIGDYDEKFLSPDGNYKRGICLIERVENTILIKAMEKGIIERYEYSEQGLRYIPYGSK